MAMRRFVPLVVSAVVGLIASVLFAVPETAGARMEPIHGDLRCAVGASQMRFSPPVAIVGDNPDPSKSRNTFTAFVSGCRGTSPTSPAPGGISRGFIELKGRLKKNRCVDATEPGTRGYFIEGPQRVKLTWYNASGVRIGRNSYGGVKGLFLAYDNFASVPISPIATIPFTSTLRSTAKAFGGEAVTARIPIDLTEFSVRCSAGPVADIPLLGGEITIGNPT